MQHHGMIDIHPSVVQEHGAILIDEPIHIYRHACGGPCSLQNLYNEHNGIVYGPL